jgi:hypothetical protein
VAGRGWRVERTVSTTDTNGVKTDITVGMSRDQRGNWKALIGIGDGPSAVLTTGQAAELIDNLRQTAATLLPHEKGQP